MWIDISQTLQDDIAHWPEDTPFSFELPVTKDKDSPVNIGRVTTSSHIGTHIDAPRHFDDDGETVEALDINRYIGDATIIEVAGDKKITREMLEGHEIYGTILLLKTTDTADEGTFPKEVATLDLEAVGYLATLGIKLFGVDVPSVDDIDSKTLEVHHTLYQHDIMIIENVKLEDVEQGYYDFIALPLNIKGGDGSPVRAAVRKKEVEMYD